MPQEQTIQGVLHSPADEHTGERKTILIKTTTDLVVDEESGKDVKTLLKEQQYSNATSLKSGLMSADNFNTLKKLSENEIIISDTNPNKPCLWFKVESVETI